MQLYFIFVRLCLFINFFAPLFHVVINPQPFADTPGFLLPPYHETDLLEQQIRRRLNVEPFLSTVSVNL